LRKKLTAGALFQLFETILIILNQLLLV